MKKLHALFLIAFLFVLNSCSKDDPEPTYTINTPTLETNYDKQHQFSLKKGSEDIFASTFTWKSSDEKVGSVDANGLFKARKIGETSVVGTRDGQTVESTIIVKPYVDIFIEPLVDFGASAATIKSKEKHKLVTEDPDGLMFEGSSERQTRYILYLMKDGKMTSSAILFDNSTATVTAATTFYKERYPDRGTSDGVAIFLSDERTFSVGMSVSNSLGFLAIYSPASISGRIGETSSQKEYEKVFKRLKLK